MIDKPAWGLQRADWFSAWKLSRQKSSQYVHVAFKLLNPFCAYLIEFCIFCITGHGNFSSRVICKTRKIQQRSVFAFFEYVFPLAKSERQALHTAFLVMFSHPLLHSQRWKGYVKAILVTFLCMRWSSSVDLHDSLKNGLMQSRD